MEQYGQILEKLAYQGIWSYHVYHEKGCIRKDLILNFAGAAIWSTYKYAYGLGFRSEKWMPIASIVGATNLRPEIIVYSNFPQALYCITRKEARFIRMADLTTGENSVRQIEQKLRKNGGMIVFFKDGDDIKELITVP